MDPPGMRGGIDEANGVFIGSEGGGKEGEGLGVGVKVVAGEFERVGLRSYASFQTDGTFGDDLIADGDGEEQWGLPPGDSVGGGGELPELVEGSEAAESSDGEADAELLRNFSKRLAQAQQESESGGQGGGSRGSGVSGGSRSVGDVMGGEVLVIGGERKRSEGVESDTSSRRSGDSRVNTPTPRLRRDATEESRLDDEGGGKERDSTFQFPPSPLPHSHLHAAPSSPTLPSPTKPHSHHPKPPSHSPSPSPSPRPPATAGSEEDRSGVRKRVVRRKREKDALVSVHDAAQSQQAAFKSFHHSSTLSTHPSPSPSPSAPSPPSPSHTTWLVAQVGPYELERSAVMVTLIDRSTQTTPTNTPPSTHSSSGRRRRRRRRREKGGGGEGDGGGGDGGGEGGGGDGVVMSSASSFPSGFHAPGLKPTPPPQHTTPPPPSKTRAPHTYAGRSRWVREKGGEGAKSGSKSVGRERKAGKVGRGHAHHSTSPRPSFAEHVPVLGVPPTPPETKKDGGRRRVGKVRPLGVTPMDPIKEWPDDDTWLAMQPFNAGISALFRHLAARGGAGVSAGSDPTFASMKEKVNTLTKPQFLAACRFLGVLPRLVKRDLALQVFQRAVGGGAGRLHAGGIADVSAFAACIAIVADHALANQPSVRKTLFLPSTRVAAALKAAKLDQDHRSISSEIRAWEKESRNREVAKPKVHAPWAITAHASREPVRATESLVDELWTRNQEQKLASLEQRRREMGLDTTDDDSDPSETETTLSSDSSQPGFKPKHRAIAKSVRDKERRGIVAARRG